MLNLYLLCMCGVLGLFILSLIGTYLLDKFIKFIYYLEDKHIHPVIITGIIGATFSFIIGTIIFLSIYFLK